jgi:glycosyltransferase involved in cell wall biosynthesis
MLGAGTACGIDLARFKRTDAIDEQARSIRREHGIDEGAVVVGYVGWLVADKGVTELVDAFATLAGARDDLHLLMIGADGTARDPLPTRTLDAVRQHPRIHHAGLVDEPAVYYAAMDFCVLPSRREGFPYAPLEAAALGVPTIATAVTGCVDAVADERTGLLVGPEDPGALRDAIRRLADAPEDRSRLGDAARSRVCEHFSSQRMVDEHIALYRGPKKVSG